MSKSVYSRTSRRSGLRTLSVTTGTLLALALASVVSGGIAEAAAPTVTCGSTVTANVTLTADLFCSSGDGVTLGANVILDLGGHSVVGPGSSGIGIQTLDDSLGGVTIRNGQVKNWGRGIYVHNSSSEAATSSTVSNIVLRKAAVSNDFGSATLRLTKVEAIDSPIWGQLGGSVAVSQSRLTRSSIDVFGANATVANSTVIEGSINSSYYGEIIIDASKLDGNGKSALGSISETSITITNSTVKSFKSPITGYYGYVYLEKNQFTNMPNGVLGEISGYPGTGGALIRGNTFTSSGVVLHGDVSMVIENNTFTRNETAVLFTMPAPFPEEPPLTAEGSRVVGNIMTKNTGYGIKTNLPGLAVKNNTARNNGGYGIYAPGAIDFGGNVASGNALGQCVGVICTAK